MLKEAAVYRQLHPHLSLIHPGVLRHTYEGEFPNLPQMEDYHIIDSTDDHLLILWCHGMPEINLNGALVLSRARTSGPDDQTLDRFEAQTQSIHPEMSLGQKNCCLLALLGALHMTNR